MPNENSGLTCITSGKISDLQRMVGENVNVIEHGFNFFIIIIGKDYKIINRKPRDKNCVSRYSLHVNEDDLVLEVEGMTYSSLEMLRMYYPYEEQIRSVDFQDDILTVRTESSVIIINPRFNPETESHEVWRFLDGLDKLEYLDCEEPVKMLKDHVVCDWISARND